MPLFKKDVEYTRTRDISVFVPDEEAPEATTPVEDAQQIYAELDEVINRAKASIDSLVPVAEAYSIPINPDENEVRAAHLQTDGDGESIKFQEFAKALQVLSDAQADYLDPTLDGLGIGDSRKVDRKKLGRAKNDLDPDKAWEDDILDIGSQALILWALNGLSGMFHSTDHSTIVAGKLPPGTESGGIIQQIIMAMLMMKFVQGMSDNAISNYETMVNTEAGNMDFGPIFKEFTERAGTPPDSDAYRQFRASMYESNSMRLVNYSTNYISKHIGDGFESWWAYLVSRDLHEQGLRTHDAGDIYISGEQGMPPAHAGVVTQQTATSGAVLDAMGGTLGRTMGGPETCCFLRWLDLFKLDILVIMRQIIQMALYAMEFNAAQSFEWYKNLANYPWRVISQKALKALDTFFEKVMKQVLDAFDIEGELWKIIQACTPVNELMGSVLNMMEYIKSWYTDLIGAIGKEWGEYAISLGAGWETMFEIRRAKEILLALDQMIAFKQQLEESESVSEDKLTGAISKVQGFMFEHHIPGTDTVQVAHDLTQEAVEWCRTLGDWDRIKSTIGLGNKTTA